MVIELLLSVCFALILIIVLMREAGKMEFFDECKDCQFKRDFDMAKEECEQVHQLNMRLETDLQLMRGELQTMRRYAATALECDDDCENCVNRHCVGAV